MMSTDQEAQNTMLQEGLSGSDSSDTPQQPSLVWSGRVGKVLLGVSAVAVVAYAGGRFYTSNKLPFASTEDRIEKDSLWGQVPKVFGQSATPTLFPPAFQNLNPQAASQATSQFQGSLQNWYGAVQQTTPMPWNLNAAASQLPSFNSGTAPWNTGSSQLQQNWNTGTSQLQQGFQQAQQTYLGNWAPSRNWASSAPAAPNPLVGDMAYEFYHVNPALNQTRYKPGDAGSGTVNYIGGEQELKQDLHDGNQCGEYEEMFEGLCYTKCKILTEGAYPYRNSGIACCADNPCLNPFHLHVGSVWPCDGYDVSSENRGKACPHSYGLCEEEEEQWGDLCYLQCNILTKGEYPWRKGPATCCNSNSVLTCLDFFNDKTDVKFAVGENGKPAHPPELSRTEAR